MKLSLFDGGLNTRAAANLIQPNESVVCSNVDSSSGILSSAKGLTEVPNLSLTGDSFWNPLTEDWLDKPHDTDPHDGAKYQNTFALVNLNLDVGHWPGEAKRNVFMFEIPITNTVDSILDTMSSVCYQ